MTVPSISSRSRVTLREITAETVRSVLGLSVHESQKRFVATNAQSLAEAHFSPHAWFRAVYADETPAGFVMLEQKPEAPAGPSYYLWRFMIDVRYQRMGFGRRAMELVIAHVRTQPGATEFLTSVVEAPGGPRPFYEGLGFRATGAYEDEEAVLRLGL